MDYGIKVKDIARVALIGGALGILTDLIATIMGTIKGETWSEDWPFGMLMIALTPCVPLVALVGLGACCRIRLTETTIEHVFLGRFVLKRCPVDQVVQIGPDPSCRRMIHFADGRKMHYPLPPTELARLLNDIWSLQMEVTAEASSCVHPHPVTIDPHWLVWNDGFIPNLAHAIREDRAFDRLPILGDALEEAGCTDEEILSHCRQPGKHVVGCWVAALFQRE